MEKRKTTLQTHTEINAKNGGNCKRNVYICILLLRVFVWRKNTMTQQQFFFLQF